MAKNIVISGYSLTGKTMVAMAIAAKLRAQGKRVAYFKPVGDRSYQYSEKMKDIDEDAAVMKEVLGMKTDVSCITPIVRARSSYDELLRIGRDTLLKKIRRCYTQISDQMDYVVVEGTEAPWHLLHVQLSTAQIAKELNATVICLVNFPDITAIDEALLDKEFFKQYGVEPIGIILNLVPPMLKTMVTEKIKPFLEQNGLLFCGVLYQNRELFSPTVREILRALDGEVVTGEDRLDLLVDTFMVGSMAPENALRWFRQATNKAVITSGDRADICLAALETDTNVLILTDGMGPDIRTISRAKQLGVPIIMTAHDAFTTADIVDGYIGSVTPENKEKVAVVERIVGDALDLSKLGL
jgi:BioD-like phosphotransacetylase family protein